ncbi:hypothetical protein SRHO_G00225090 [Serrasalmus rhombeus]
MAFTEYTEIQSRGLKGWGATWDLQPEKLDFSQFHRKQFRGTPKHLPHIDREGMMKGKFDDDGIDLNDMEKFLPGLPVSFSFHHFIKTLFQGLEK